MSMNDQLKIDQRDYRRLVDYMKSNYGINLEGKQTLIEGRLGVQIQRRGFSDFTSYIDHALSDRSGTEAGLLITRLTTNYTYFMREEQHFSYLTDTILPEWLPRIQDRDLRIWSAGCSSGEEPYTLAMVLLNYFARVPGAWDHTVLATDISAHVLQLARTGIYARESLQRLPDSFRTKYFTKIDEDTVRVTDQMRRQVAFGEYNLMEQCAPFKRKFHVIFCRNVMIYFDERTKQGVVDRFADQLEPGGYLIIGHSETLTGISTRMRNKRPSIYQKET